MISINDMAAFCKRKGFIYSSAEIYGSLAGFFDFGPYGVELKNNIKKEWWKYHVKQREDIVGIDGSIISGSKIWKASGHLANFADLMLTCDKCKKKTRADTYIEEELNINADGLKADEINKLVKDNGLTCSCGGNFQEVKDFNLMFKTNVGAEENNIAYLRPETAQMIFANFKLVMDNARMKPPFGIAQIGKSFRNEISPRNFLFRCREFEQMELEYFILPRQTNECPFYQEYKNYKINVLSSHMQDKKEQEKEMKISDAGIKNPWLAYFLAYEHNWFTKLGANPENFRIRQHLEKEKSHYANETWDLEYKFPFGWKELEGLANRTDYDLKAHMKESGSDLTFYDEETKEKILPHVICEPSLGVERSFLVFMYEAYTDDKRGNITLKLDPKLAPIKVGVFPLVNKLDEKAKEIFNMITIDSTYDKGGSVGRRYARADEIGIPYCVTVDFDTLEGGTVTIRDRDTTEQKRVKIEELNSVIGGLVNGSKKWNDL